MSRLSSFFLFLLGCVLLYLAMFSEIECFPVEYPILQRASSEVLQRCSDTENLKVSMKTFKAHQKTMRTFDNTRMHAEGVIQS